MSEDSEQDSEVYDTLRDDYQIFEASDMQGVVGDGYEDDSDFDYESDEVEIATLGLNGSSEGNSSEFLMRRREGNDVDFDVFANAGARGGFSPDTPGESSLGDSSATDLSGDAGHLRAHEAVAHRYSHMPASLTRLDLLADPDLPRFPGNLDSDDSNTDFSEGGDIDNGVESTLAEATPMDALINSKKLRLLHIEEPNREKLAARTLSDSGHGKSEDENNGEELLVFSGAPLAGGSARRRALRKWTSAFAARREEILARHHKNGLARAAANQNGEKDSQLHLQKFLRRMSGSRPDTLPVLTVAKPPEKQEVNMHILSDEGSETFALDQAIEMESEPDTSESDAELDWARAVSAAMTEGDGDPLIGARAKDPFIAGTTTRASAAVQGIRGSLQIDHFTNGPDASPLTSSDLGEETPTVGHKQTITDHQSPRQFRPQQKQSNDGDNTQQDDDAPNVEPNAELALAEKRLKMAAGAYGYDPKRPIAYEDEVSYLKRQLRDLQVQLTSARAQLAADGSKALGPFALTEEQLAALENVHRGYEGDDVQDAPAFYIDLDFGGEPSSMQKWLVPPGDIIGPFHPSKGYEAMNRDPRFKKLRSAQKNVGDPLEGHPIDGKPALQSPESSLMKPSRDMSPTSLSLLEYNGVEPEMYDIKGMQERLQQLDEYEKILSADLEKNRAHFIETSNRHAKELEGFAFNPVGVENLIESGNQFEGRQEQIDIGNTGGVSPSRSSVMFGSPNREPSGDAANTPDLALTQTPFAKVIRSPSGNAEFGAADSSRIESAEAEVSHALAEAREIYNEIKATIGESNPTAPQTLTSTRAQTSSEPSTQRIAFSGRPSRGHGVHVLINRGPILQRVVKAKVPRRYGGPSDISLKTQQSRYQRNIRTRTASSFR